MKGILKFTITILIIIVLSSSLIYSLQLQTYLFKNKRINQITNPVTHQQTKGQVEFFREALDNFGATSPEQVIKIWSETEKSRNGVFHYAVACDELKEKIIKEWGEPEENFWICGGSSPWLDKYEIVYNKKLSDFLYEVKIKFFWSTSTGPYNTSETTLTIVKNKNIWCVKEVK